MTIEPEFHEVENRRESGGLTYFQLRYDPSLFEGASCKGLDTELFYPDMKNLPKDEQRFFNTLCHLCPVREACMEWGLAHEKYGIWGGLTPDQRHLYRKALKWGVNDLTASEHLPL